MFPAAPYQPFCPTTGSHDFNPFFLPYCLPQERPKLLFKGGTPEQQAIITKVFWKIAESSTTYTLPSGKNFTDSYFAKLISSVMDGLPGFKIAITKNLASKSTGNEAAGNYNPADHHISLTMESGISEERIASYVRHELIHASRHLFNFAEGNFPFSVDAYSPLTEQQFQDAINTGIKRVNDVVQNHTPNNAKIAKWIEGICHQYNGTYSFERMEANAQHVPPVGSQVQPDFMKRADGTALNHYGTATIMASDTPNEVLIQFNNPADAILHRLYHLSGSIKKYYKPREYWYEFEARLYEITPLPLIHYFFREAWTISQEALRQAEARNKQLGPTARAFDIATYEILQAQRASADPILWNLQQVLSNHTLASSYSAPELLAIIRKLREHTDYANEQQMQQVNSFIDYIINPTNNMAPEVKHQATALSDLLYQRVEDARKQAMCDNDAFNPDGFLFDDIVFCIQRLVQQGRIGQAQKVHASGLEKFKMNPVAIEHINNALPAELRAVANSRRMRRS